MRLKHRTLLISSILAIVAGIVLSAFVGPYVGSIGVARSVENKWAGFTLGPVYVATEIVSNVTNSTYTTVILEPVNFKELIFSDTNVTGFEVFPVNASTSGVTVFTEWTYPYVGIGGFIAVVGIGLFAVAVAGILIAALDEYVQRRLGEVPPQ